MPYLTEEEILEHRSWLDQWRSPGQMLEYADDIMNHMAADTGDISVALFNQPGINFVSEAWAAAKFAGVVDADEVMVPLEDPPDFLLRFGDREEHWEIVEADEKDRRRGDEYREGAAQWEADQGLVKEDPVEDWVARADQVPEVLRARTRAKAKKMYSPGTNLLVYLNINEFGIRQREIERSLAPSTEAAKDAFQTVWILWKATAYRTWKHGQPAWRVIGKPPPLGT